MILTDHFPDAKKESSALSKKTYGRITVTPKQECKRKTISVVTAYCLTAGWYTRQIPKRIVGFMTIA